MKTLIYITLLLLSFVSTTLLASPVKAPDPGPKDTCPVCGMFVAKYPAWVASVVYEDGHVHHFDGAKDLFKYLLDLPKWAPKDKADNIATIAVTEYYNLVHINAREAFYVIGSDTLGPMGHELIPFENQEDAKEFMKDHNGEKILKYKDVTLKLLGNLDNGVLPK
jgi:nitrous oxide reductase accessory protein NosL